MGWGRQGLGPLRQPLYPHPPPRSYPPFISEKDDQQELFALIKAARYGFDPADWGSISDGVKDLIRHILVADPTARYTAKQARRRRRGRRGKGWGGRPDPCPPSFPPPRQILDHPWMKLDASAVPDVALGGTVAQLKRFNARRRLKGAMATVRSTVRGGWGVCGGETSVWEAWGGGELQGRNPTTTTHPPTPALAGAHEAHHGVAELHLSDERGRGRLAADRRARSGPGSEGGEGQRRDARARCGGGAAGGVGGRAAPMRQAKHSVLCSRSYGTSEAGQWHATH